MYTSKMPTCYLAVCNVLDELADSAGRPINWRRPVYAAIDELRAIDAPAEQIDTAERLSIALLKLDWAIQKSDGERQEELREQLAELGETWRSQSEAAPMAQDDVMDAEEVGSVTAALERITQRF
jgi:hypothetical protein